MARKALLGKWYERRSVVWWCVKKGLRKHAWKMWSGIGSLKKGSHIQPEMKVMGKARSTDENLEWKHRLPLPDPSEQMAFHQKLNVPYKRGLLHSAPQPSLERELGHWRRGQTCIPGALTLDQVQQPYIS